MTQDAEVTVEHQNQVAIVRLNRPDRLNAEQQDFSGSRHRSATSRRRPSGSLDHHHWQRPSFLRWC